MRIFLFVLFFITTSTFAQTNYPQDYFRSPLDIPMNLAGNFGELRPNHFHAGFDFKTNQREGLKVYAVADGYVSRIKISRSGYGRAIYITHPNGYTTVYGHLQRAVGEIEDYIHKEHYKEHEYEIEMFLKPDELKVTKGQVIALSGNTGSSGGPHLHFEIRDSKTEFIINPFLFGFDKLSKDTKKPVISSLYVYPLGANTTVNQSKRPLMLSLSTQKDGTLLSDRVAANGKIGFGVNTSDYDNISGNRNGAYKVESFYNGTSNFEYHFSTYSFDDTRYVNALIDYERYKKTGQRVQQLFMKKPYGLSIIKTDFSGGQIDVKPNLTSIYRIEVSDYFGNKNIINIPIQYNSLPAIVDAEPKKSEYFVKANKDSNFSKNNMSVFFPADTFLEDFDMNFDVKNDKMYIHQDVIPAYSNFTITIQDDKHTEAERNKLFIGRFNGKSYSYNFTTRKDSIFTAKSKILGQYKLVSDNVPPTITTVKAIEGKSLDGDKTLQFKINDNLSGINTYRGFLNGKWILFEYEPKTKKITHYFSDGIVAEGANNLKIEVTDNVGNLTTFETQFFRSQK